MKALLIEDRKERQKLFMEKFNINLEEYKDVLFNSIDEKYQKIYEDLRNENYEDLKNFDVIISHKSAFEGENSKIIHRLEKFSKENNKKLVFFSGGIDGIYYDKENEFEYMELNSMIFYSKNLELFLNELKEDKDNILILAYGKKWKLNILIEFLDTMTKYIMDLDENLFPFPYEYFKEDLELIKLKEFGFKIKFNKEEITKPEMIEIKNNLSNYIEEIIKYENYNSQ